MDTLVNIHLHLAQEIGFPENTINAQGQADNNNLGSSWNNDAWIDIFAEPRDSEEDDEKQAK